MTTPSYLRLRPFPSNLLGWPETLPPVFPDDCPEISDVLPADLQLHEDREDVSRGRVEPV